MRALLSILLTVAAPASAPALSIAVEWRGEDQHDDALHRSLRAALAGLDGRPADAIPERAHERAGIAVAHELPVELRELRREARAHLDRADEAYRQGRFDDALAELGAALERLDTAPAIPGAAASAREAHLLAAKLAWARSDHDAADAALHSALILDPEAQLSIREAAPALVDRYHALQAQLLAGREHDWPTPTITDASALELEFDGVAGLRPLPPGRHVAVAHQAGRSPVAAWIEADGTWTPSFAAARLPEDPDRAATDICETLGLDRLVYAEHRDARVGVQVYNCQHGFGPLWTGPRERLDDGVAQALAGPFDGERLTLADPWPVLVPIDVPPPTPTPDRVPRPWYRRGWVWGTSASVAAVVVGGIVTGVVLAGRERPGPTLHVDSNQFID